MLFYQIISLSLSPFPILPWIITVETPHQTSGSSSQAKKNTGQAALNNQKENQYYQQYYTYPNEVEAEKQQHPNQAPIVISPIEKSLPQDAKAYAERATIYSAPLSQYTIDHFIQSRIPSEDTRNNRQQQIQPSDPNTKSGLDLAELTDDDILESRLFRTAKRPLGFAAPLLINPDQIPSASDGNQNDDDVKSYKQHVPFDEETIIYGSPNYYAAHDNWPILNSKEQDANTQYGRQKMMTSSSEFFGQDNDKSGEEMNDLLLDDESNSFVPVGYEPILRQQLLQAAQTLDDQENHNQNIRQKSIPVLPTPLPSVHQTELKDENKKKDVVGAARRGQKEEVHGEVPQEVEKDKKSVKFLPKNKQQLLMSPNHNNLMVNQLSHEKSYMRFMNSDGSDDQNAHPAYFMSEYHKFKSLAHFRQIFTSWIFNGSQHQMVSLLRSNKIREWDLLF